jgi:hypothetical protein
MFKIDYYIFKYFLASKMAALRKICLMVIHLFTAYFKRRITSSPSDSHTVLHTLWGCVNLRSRSASYFNFNLPISSVVSISIRVRPILAMDLELNSVFTLVHAILEKMCNIEILKWDIEEKIDKLIRDYRLIFKPILKTYDTFSIFNQNFIFTKMV